MFSIRSLFQADLAGQRTKCNRRFPAPVVFKYELLRRNNLSCRKKYDASRLLRGNEHRSGNIHRFQDGSIFQQHKAVVVIISRYSLPWRRAVSEAKRNSTTVLRLTDRSTHVS